MDTRFLPPPRETYQAAYDKARRDMANLDPVRAAGLAGVEYVATAPGEGEFRLPYFWRQLHASPTPAWPWPRPRAAASPRWSPRCCSSTTC